MDTNWSVEAGTDDPVIVVPWFEGLTGSSQRLEFIDLKSNPVAVDQITEAQVWPELRKALAILNATDSAVWTAKCDAWVLDEEERELDFGPVAFGFGVYLDVLPSEISAFISLDWARASVEQWTKLARAIPPEAARADFVIRPAVWNDEAGFATTLYVFGYGAADQLARRNWSDALLAIATLVAAQTSNLQGRYNSDAGE